MKETPSSQRGGATAPTGVTPSSPMREPGARQAGGLDTQVEGLTGKSRGELRRDVVRAVKPTN